MTFVKIFSVIIWILSTLVNVFIIVKGIINKNYFTLFLQIFPNDNKNKPSFSENVDQKFVTILLFIFFALLFTVFALL